ncbi:MAG: calcium/sodium antiporter [Methanobacteriaceae archaeon]|nr:calcium/sodium antiporter [Methanobacteriaceae archaeon]
MISWIILLFLFLISLLILIKAADVFVENLVEIGRYLGISQVILGITVAAGGTSLPEFGSAIISVLTGSPDLGVGVVIGSNIWNIAGIIGIAASISCVISTNRDEIRRDGIMVLITSTILLFFMVLGDINTLTGIILISIYVIYLYILIKKQQKYSKNHEKTKKINIKSLSFKIILLTIISFFALIISARILVFSAVEIASLAQVPEIIVGLFGLAIGTSMAELVVTVTSARKNMCSLAVGTVLGSNIFNILIGIGVPALFVKIPVEPLSILIDAPVLIIITIILLLFMRSKMELSRKEGITLILIYGVYAFLRIFLLT